MMFIAQIQIMPKTELLDPAGKAVLATLQNHLDLGAAKDVRVGKLVTLKIEAASKEEAEKIAKEASDKLIVNQVMEDYTFTVEAL